MSKYREDQYAERLLELKIKYMFLTKNDGIMKFISKRNKKVGISSKVEILIEELNELFQNGNGFEIELHYTLINKNDKKEVKELNLKFRPIETEFRDGIVILGYDKMVLLYKILKRM